MVEESVACNQGIGLVCLAWKPSLEGERPLMLALTRCGPSKGSALFHAAALIFRNHCILGIEV